MDPTFLLLVLYISLLGSLIGAFTGITPGIHVNTMALFVSLSSAAIIAAACGVLTAFQVDPDLAPVLLACLLVSAAVSHSFLDFLPSVFFGAPEESECLTMLPGHRLLLAGRGLEAVAVAAEGSLLGALLSLLVCVPLMAVGPVLDLDSRMDPYIPGLMLMAAVLLVMNERDGRGSEYVLHAHRISIQTCWRSTTPVPVPGQEDTVYGHIVSEWPLGRRVECNGTSFRLKHHRFIGPGDFLLTGTWHLYRRRWIRPAWALLVFLLSGLAGLAVMDGRPRLAGVFDGIGSSLLLPLLTGLFALPSLLGSTRSGKIPQQMLDLGQGVETTTTLQGSLAGLFSAWVPGVTATSGTVLAQQMTERKDDDPDEAALRFIAMTAALGTAATVFGVMAFCLTGSGGTGVLVAVGDIVPDEIDASALSAALLLSVLVASLSAYRLTRFCGRRLASWLSGRSSGAMSLAILLFELALCAVLTGLPGMMVLAACTLLGMLPPHIGVSRVCLTGCLLLPLLLGAFSVDGFVLSLLGG